MIYRKTVPHVDDTDCKVRRSNAVATMSFIQFIRMTSIVWAVRLNSKNSDVDYTHTQI